MKKLIVGYYGFRNTGDDAMLTGLLDEIGGIGDTTVLHGPDLANKDIYPAVRFVPWSLSNLKAETLKTDAVVFGGGTMFRNWGKGWLWQSCKVTGYMALVKAAGKKLFMMNIGNDSGKAAAIAMNLADYYTNREDTFDNAALIKNIPVLNKNSKTLAVLLTPKWGIYYGRPDMDDIALSSIVESVNKWLNKDYERRVKFISLNGHPVHTDDAISLAGASRVGSRAEFVPWNPDVHSVLRILSECCGAIGMRYHACLLSFLVGVPLIYVRTKPYCDRLYSRLSSWSIVEPNANRITSAYLDCLPMFQYNIGYGAATELARKGICF